MYKKCPSCGDPLEPKACIVVLSARVESGPRLVVRRVQEEVAGERGWTR